MAWYEYNQNNSGGSFVEDDSVGKFVLIEAESAEKANSRAESVGIYFDGCDKDYDCPCCGDRWYPAWRDEGAEKPSIYGKQVTRRKGTVLIDGFASGLYEGTTLHLYHKNGTHERIFTKGGKVTGHARD